ncbi:hypothetical protein F7P10_10310 [Actinomadura sp. WMMB 499]|nr:hypothetical protein F7P10_10310 [Actinomadura sp. WMMB 499]
MARLLPGEGSETEFVTELEVLGEDASVLGRYYVFPSLTERAPEGVLLSGYVWGRPPLPEEEEIWDIWRSGPPRESGLWTRYGPQGRRAWTHVALHRHVRTDGADRPDGSTFELDGTHVTDSAGFFCALGEAINGPGGYYGAGLDSLSDCMSGGYGTAGRFTLLWTHFEVARRSWKTRKPDDLAQAPSLESVLDVLGRGNVILDHR